MTSFRLDEQVAFVTGAGSGIGQAIALGLAEAGADVACFDLAASGGLNLTIGGPPGSAGIHQAMIEQ